MAKDNSKLKIKVSEIDVSLCIDKLRERMENNAFHCKKGEVGKMIDELNFIQSIVDVQPHKNKGYEAKNMRARALNAERMVEKLSSERSIIRGWSISKNYIIIILAVSLILNLIF